MKILLAKQKKNIHVVKLLYKLFLLFRQKVLMQHRLFLFLVTGVLVSHASAATIKPVIPVNDWSWVTSISAGPVWARGGETQTFYLTPQAEKSYVAKKSANGLASGELFVGAQKLLSSQWLGQVGLAVASSDNAKLQGAIWDDADPQFNNYSYQYNVQTTRIALKGKLLFDRDYWLMPWVSASLGVNFNRAYGFTSTPLIFEALPSANFTDRTKTAFTYTLGVGLQKRLKNHWQIGIGYEFADWGKSELGRASGQTLNSGLTLNHLYSNGVLLNLTYVA